MTAQHPQPEKLAYVVRLAMLLVRRVLATLLMERTIPTQQAIALAEAGELLRNHDAGWSPLLSQVVYELGGDRESGHAEQASHRRPEATTRLKARQP